MKVHPRLFSIVMISAVPFAAQTTRGGAISSPAAPPVTSGTGNTEPSSNLFVVPCKDAPECGDLTVALDGSSFVQPQEVPSSVDYKEATREDRVAAAAKLMELLIFRAPDGMEKLAGSAVVCGPGLWRVLGGEVKEALPKATCVLVVSSSPAMPTIDFHPLQTPEERAAFLRVLRKRFSGKLAVVRRLKSPELSYFWTVRPYPIDSPLIAIEIGDQVLVAHFLMDGKNPHLFVLDAVVDPATLAVK